MEWIKIFSQRVEANSKLSENKPQLVIMREKRICLVKRNNCFYAVSNKCPHNGESLSKGTVNAAGEIVCPWHGYQFDLATGREYQERCADLETFPVRDEEDGLYIAL
jgi:3-phenylpropionate/trans-cinnamate dioxygenase ferredoxin subunit